MLLLAAFLYVRILMPCYVSLCLLHINLYLCGWGGVCALCVCLFSHNLCTSKFCAFVNVLPDLLWFSAVSIFGNVIHNNSMGLVLSGIWAHHILHLHLISGDAGGNHVTGVHGVPLSHPVHFHAPRRNWFLPFLFLDTFAMYSFVCLLCIQRGCIVYMYIV